MNNEQRASVIKELLMKYTDPKPEFTGISASMLSLRIVEAIEKAEKEEMENSLAPEPY